MSAAKSSRARLFKVALASASLALSTYLVIAGWWRLQEGTGSDVENAKDPGRPGRRLPPSPARPTVEELARTVLVRNMFDSASGPGSWEVEASPVQSDPAVSAPEPSTSVVACPEGTRLLAAVVFDREPERSFGVLRNGDTTRQMSVGTSVENTTLVALGPTYAHVQDNTGVVCRVPLFGQAGATPARPPAAHATKEASKKGKKEEKQLFSATELEAGITSLGGDHYRIRRELLTRAMADAAGVVRGSKFFPQTGGARNAGVKITGVPESSVLHKLGVRSGDILRTLNGVDLSSTDGMLGAYALLREQSTVTLAITRGGSARTLEYVSD